jgi:hypothetical protein
MHWVAPDIFAEAACQVTDPRLLVIAFSLGSKVQWEFTPDEFIGGLAKHKYTKSSILVF